MKKNIVITVLTILVLGLAVYIVYDKIIANGDTNKNVSDGNFNEMEETKKLAKKIDGAKDYVYDAYNNSEYSVDYDFLNSYTNSILSSKKGIAVPFINIDTEEAKKINDEMKELFDSTMKKVDEILACDHPSSCGQIFLNYNTYYSDNIVSIIVSYGMYGTDIPYPSYLGYVFDLTNGKLLNITDIADINNISMEKLKEMSKDKIKEYLIDMDNKNNSSEYVNYIDKSIQNFENKYLNVGQGQVATITYDYYNSNPESGVIYFIDSDRKINLLTNIYIPAGSGFTTELLVLN